MYADDPDVTQGIAQFRLDNCRRELSDNICKLLIIQNYDYSDHYLFIFTFFLLFPPCRVLQVLLVERLLSSRLLMPGTADHRLISKSRIRDGVAQRK